jgi:hypothetical protein
MLIKEYRIPLPMTVEEYRIAQLYMIAKKSREETKVGTRQPARNLHLRALSPIFWTKKSTFSLKLVQVRKTQHDSLNHETSDST